MYPPISDVREIILQNLENRKKKEKLNIEILWEHDMKIHFSSWRGKTKSNFSSRISRDRDSCQGLEGGYLGEEKRCLIKLYLSKLHNLFVQIESFLVLKKIPQDMSIDPISFVFLTVFLSHSLTLIL